MIARGNAIDRAMRVATHHRSVHVVADDVMVSPVFFFGEQRRARNHVPILRAW